MEQTANQDYFLDADGNVTANAEEAATLLIRKGQAIPQDMAEKYGDAFSGKVARQADTAKETATDEESAAEPKAETKKPANKKATPSKNKGAK